MRNIVVTYFLAFFFAANVNAEKLNLQQVIQQVLHHYPSIRTAALQVEVARQESIRINSQLGWQLNASGGYRHDFSLFGSPNDRFDITGGLSRQLSSGDSLSLSAQLARDNSDVAISPFYPNPATNVNIELNYRMPLQKGSENIGFTQSLTTAELNTHLNEWQLRSLLDQLATQVIDLYFSYAVTQVRIENNRSSILRTKKLKKYLSERTLYGISEDKDILQVDAQLSSQEAELQAINIQASLQNISLNKLMNKDWGFKFTPEIKYLDDTNEYDFNQVYQQVVNVNADIKQLNKKIKLAESNIKVQRDKKKDKLDLVLFIGDKNLSGDVQAGSLNENEIVGGARLEFSRGLDASGDEAQLYQALLQRDVALQSKKQLMQDLQYRLASLLSQINTGRAALNAYQASVEAQRKKLAEAESRYRDGRVDTDLIIQFENQLSLASLAESLQSLELKKLNIKISLLQGVLWQSVQIPEYSLLLKQGK